MEMDYSWILVLLGGFLVWCVRVKIEGTCVTIDSKVPIPGWLLFAGMWVARLVLRCFIR